VMTIYSNRTAAEVPIYGSSRIGEYMGKEKEGYQTFNLRKYELTNHLGNVLAVISDKVNLYGHNNTLDSARATAVSASDYYPFGLPMKGRLFSEKNFRYGFNGQEKTDEISGAGNHTTAMYWEYDTRLGRRWNLDPKPTPSISQYNCFAGNPMWFSDILGDTIAVTSAFSSDKNLSNAYSAFAKTEEGFNFLSKYVAEGQIINGVKIAKNGEYHDKGIDLTFDAKDMLNNDRRGETGTNADKERLNITTTFNTSSNPNFIGEGVAGQSWDRIKTLTHEGFIHANMFTRDFLQDGKIDYSNVPSAIKRTLQTNSGRHGHHWTVVGINKESISKNGKPRGYFATEGFWLLRKVANTLNYKVTDQEIVNKMRSFSGGPTY